MTRIVALLVNNRHQFYINYTSSLAKVAGEFLPKTSRVKYGRRYAMKYLLGID